MAAGLSLAELTNQHEEKALGHFLHDTAVEQGCRRQRVGCTGVRRPSPRLTGLGGESQSIDPKGELAYGEILGKLLISVFLT